MHEEITSLIRSGNYIKAHEQITNALNKSFNLSNRSERSDFTILQKLKDEIFQSIMLKNGEVIVENFRSSTQQNKKLEYPIIDEKKYFEFMESLEGYIAPRNKSKVYDSTVNIILHPIKTDNNTFTLLSEAGAYADDPDYESFEQIYLRGYDKNECINLSKVIEGLNYISTFLLEDNKQDVVLYFPIMHEDLSESALLLTLYSILNSIVTFVVSNQNENKINIYWKFDDQQVEELFRIVILKARVIKANPQITENKFVNLSNEALTSNADYLEQLLSIVHIIDEVDVPILLLGETGVGKSYLAEKIHKSKSGDSSFVSVNCASIQDTLVESVLFGSIEGTATDVKTKPGRVKLAEGGTLFLDEIDRASGKFRDAVLTFIDTKKYYPVGGTKEVTANVRLLYGSNKDFNNLISEGKFEDDFLRRINKRAVTIPPLRKRSEDIPLIVKYILNKLNNKKQSNIVITSEAISSIQKLPLKGNIRDIESIIEDGFYRVKYSDKFGVISEEHVEKFKKEKGKLSNEFYQQIELAKIFMLNYNIIKENMNLSQKDKFFLIKDFIMPIFAHIFLNEIYDKKTNSPDKTLSEQICGSSMDRGNAATIIKKAEEFNNLQNLF